MAQSLRVEIIGDASSLSRAFGQASNSGAKFGRAMLRQVAIIASIGKVAQIAWSELAEGQEVAAQTSAVLKSTGGAAKVSAKQVTDLAASVSEMSGIDDEAVQSGQNMLLTFTKIRNEVGKGNDVFTQATRITADVSTALGKDMTTSALLVGKALNDPIKGVGALSRAGVQFTVAQKAQIAAMVQSGNVMGAQKLILAELTTQFGGSAKAAGETIPGQMAKARNAFSNMAGSLLTLLLPALVRLATGIATAARFVQAHIPQIQAFFQRMQAAAQTAVTWIQANIVPGIRNVVTAVTAIWNRLSGVTAAAWGLIKTVVMTAVNIIKNVVLLVLAVLRGDWSAAWNALKGIASAALSGVVGVIRGVVGLVLAAAKALGKAIWDGMKAGLVALAGLAGDLVSKIGSAVKDAAGRVYEKGKQIAGDFVRGVVAGIASLPGAIAGKIAGAFGGGGDPSKSKLIPGVRFGGGIAKRLKELQSGLDASLAAVAAYQGRLDQIAASRAAKDRSLAVRDAQAALAQARKKGEGVAAAERALNQAREAITVAGIEKRLAKEQRALDRFQQIVDAARERLGRAFDGMAARITRAFDAVTDAFEAPAEGELATIAARRKAEDQAQAVTDAERELADARIDLANAIDPTMEAAARARILAAERALARALEDITISSLERQAADQRTAWERERSNLRERLESRLAAIQAHFTAEGATFATATQGILDILSSYGVSFADVGALLGGSFVRALRDSIGEVSGAAEAVGVALAPTPKAGTAATMGKAKAFARGGIVTRPTLALIGEKGPEAVVPLSRSGGNGGGDTNHFHFHAPVGSKEDVIAWVAEGLIRRGRRVPGALGGLA